MVEIEAKGLVWDLDGTLINSFEYFYDLMTEIAPGYGFAMPAREIALQNYHGKLADTMKALLPGVDDQAVRKILLDFYELQNEVQPDVEELFFPDALSLVRRAHKAGLHQLIVSNRVNKDHGNGSPKVIIKSPSLDGMIDEAVCGDDNEFHKPDPRLLDGAIARTGLGRGDFVVIGDQFVDAQLAKNLGANAILVNRNNDEIPHLERLGSDWESHVTIVHSLDEVVIK